MIKPSTQVDGFFYKVLKDIQTTIKTQIPEFNEVRIWNGTFKGVEDFKNISTTAPCVLVGVTGVNHGNRNHSGQLLVTLDFNLVFLVKDIALADTSKIIALDILEKLLLLVKDGHWGKECRLNYTIDGSINAVIEESDDKTSCIWSLTWQQVGLLGKDRFDDEGEIPTNYTVRTSENKQHAEDVAMNFDVNDTNSFSERVEN